jgi:hypothetical protein
MLAAGLLAAAAAYRGGKELLNKYVRDNTDLKLLRGQCALIAHEAFRKYQAKRENNSRYRPDGSRGRDEWTDGEFTISVTNGYSRDRDEYTTDILVIPHDAGGAKLHVLFNERGDEILNEWHEAT